MTVLNTIQFFVEIVLLVLLTLSLGRDIYRLIHHDEEEK